jgi:micrococcal nuclease
MLILVPSISFGWTGKVVNVADGDTITVLHNGRQEKIRLYGIDAPEKKQGFGNKSREYLSSFVAGQLVEIDRKDTDKYRRTVGIVSLGSENINELMVTSGYAWVYRKYCKESFCSDWLKMEASAKDKRDGLWSETNVTPPWEFRHPAKNQTSAH